MHLYLSPHFDDVVLSCGGAIARQVMAGEQVVVATSCAAAPDLQQLSPFARFQHERWQQVQPHEDILATRQEEDLRAGEALGITMIHLHDLDCIYRRDLGGRWFYHSDDDIFGALHPQDSDAELRAELEALCRQWRPSTVYAPLAAGHHVDHQRVKNIVSSWITTDMKIFYYEDFPYIEDVQNLWRALNDPLPQQDWSRHLIPLQETHVARKIEAIACYKSQLEVLFKGEMSQRVRTQCQRTGAPGQAEAIWYPAARTP